jgi:hypothetical protein
MQHCVQIYLGLMFNKKNMDMLREIKNSEINFNESFANKRLFTLADIDMNKYFSYLNNKAIAVFEDIKSNSTYSPDDIGDKVYEIYDDIADMYIFSREVLENWQLIANECTKNLNIIYCSSTQFLNDDVDEKYSLLNKILSIENGPDCAENTSNIIVSCGSKHKAKQLNDINLSSNTNFIGFDGCVQIYGKDIYKKRDIDIDPIPINIDEFNEYFTDDKDILIKFINIYFDFALKRYYNKYNTELLITSIKRLNFSGLKKKLPCGDIECELDQQYIDFYKSFYSGGKGKRKKRQKENKTKRKKGKKEKRKLSKRRKLNK